MGIYVIVKCFASSFNSNCVEKKFFISKILQNSEIESKVPLSFKDRITLKYKDGDVFFDPEYVKFKNDEWKESFEKHANFVIECEIKERKEVYDENIIESTMPSPPSSPDVN